MGWARNLIRDAKKVFPRAKNSIRAARQCRSTLPGRCSDRRETISSRVGCRPRFRGHCAPGGGSAAHLPRPSPVMEIAELMDAGEPKKQLRLGRRVYACNLCSLTSAGAGRPGQRLPQPPTRRRRRHCKLSIVNRTSIISPRRKARGVKGEIKIIFASSKNFNCSDRQDEMNEIK